MALTQKQQGRQAPEKSFLGWLEDNNRRFPDKIFIHSLDQDKSITHGGMYRLAARIARALNARGIGANDRVALLSNNSLEHLAAYIGTLARGATICTIHVEMNAAYFEDILKAIDAKLVLYQDGLELEKLDGAVPGEWVRLGDWREEGGDGFFAEVARQEDGPAPAPVNTPDDIASIFYTSGTASRPKGVVCSYAELYENSRAVADAFAISADDRVLDFRSYNWVSAQLFSLLAPLAMGATLLMARRFSQSRFFDWVRDHGATIAAGNPTTINMLINRPVEITAADLPALRFITSSSAPLMVEDWKRFEEMYGVPICQGYGASEYGWIAGSNENARRMGSVGRPLPYHNVRIVDAAGNALPAGKVGLIELGRADDAEYRYLTDDGAIRVNATGRARTGDMGLLDGDGFLTVTGREKDLIIRGGANIAPVEIDNIVLELPEVAEVATVGVADRIYGQEVVVYVTPRAGAEIDEARIFDHCRTRLPEAKMPKQVIFRDALPKTERGKMDRNALAEAWKRENPKGG